ncbi:MAG: (d)CMP kinase [Deferribacteres bacterium]|nr:(d)CMP kinase [candidate division KSB1 bacterium]MCB9502393.1 (d)CMP kinase [Deferribacteres bacterium]
MKNTLENHGKTHEIIAIDGPAGSGKSTTARLVAQKLGFTYLDTGALYRAVTHVAMLKGVDLANEQALDALIEICDFKLSAEGDLTRVWADSSEITEAIRSREVTSNVSLVSKHAKVRQAMVRLQRAIASQGFFVVEGRDIGTVVFPNAALKIYLVATVEARTERRMLELQQKGVAVEFEKLREEIIIRDKKDSERAIAPLKKAEDAIELDTTRLTIDQQVETIVRKYKEIRS